MSFVVVIPARFASTRLPGKPLLDIAGKPMIQHVYERAKSSNADAVYIATDHQGIADAAASFGAQAVMTSADHESGTDRLQEVVQKLGLADDQVVVNVQGDEPLLPAAVINQIAKLMQDKQTAMASLYEWVEDDAQVFDPNVVKVVTDEQDKALYFSRAPMPWYRDGFAQNQQSLPADYRYKRHVGIYAYQAKLLHQFVKWPVAQLENIEKLEQLRVLANGQSIAMALACDKIPAGVDTAEDLAVVKRLLETAENT